MIKHIVMWRMKDEAHGNDKATNIKIAKEKLEALVGIIPGLSKLEFGTDFSCSPVSYDCVLYSELESRDALDIYKNHPAHREAASFILSACAERIVVDYEI